MVLRSCRVTFKEPSPTSSTRSRCSSFSASLNTITVSPSGIVMEKRPSWPELVYIPVFSSKTITEASRLPSSSRVTPLTVALPPGLRVPSFPITYNLFLYRASTASRSGTSFIPLSKYASGRSSVATTGVFGTEGGNRSDPVPSTGCQPERDEKKDPSLWLFRISLRAFPLPIRSRTPSSRIHQRLTYEK